MLGTGVEGALKVPAFSHAFGCHKSVTAEPSPTHPHLTCPAGTECPRDWFVEAAANRRKEVHEIYKSRVLAARGNVRSVEPKSMWVVYDSSLMPYFGPPVMIRASSMSEFKVELGWLCCQRQQPCWRVGVQFTPVLHNHHRHRSHCLKTTHAKLIQEAMLKAADPNGDGVVTHAEVEGLIRKYDLNQDDVLQHYELTAIVRDLLKISEDVLSDHDVKKFVRAIDGNGNGNVSVVELAHFIKHGVKNNDDNETAQEKPVVVWPGAHEQFWFDRPEECMHVMEVTRDPAGHTVRKPFDFGAQPQVGTRLVVVSGVITPRAAPKTLQWSFNPAYRGASISVSNLGTEATSTNADFRYHMVRSEVSVLPCQDPRYPSIHLSTLPIYSSIHLSTLPGV